jgi:hypothetical protein
VEVPTRRARSDALLHPLLPSTQPRPARQPRRRSSSCRPPQQYPYLHQQLYFPVRRRPPRAIPSFWFLVGTTRLDFPTPHPLRTRGDAQATNLSMLHHPRQLISIRVAPLVPPRFDGRDVCRPGQLQRFSRSSCDRCECGCVCGRLDERGRVCVWRDESGQREGDAERRRRRRRRRRGLESGREKRAEQGWDRSGNPVVGKFFIPVCRVSGPLC